MIVSNITELAQSYSLNEKHLFAEFSQEKYVTIYNKNFNFEKEFYIFSRNAMSLISRYDLEIEKENLFSNSPLGKKEILCIEPF